MIPSLVTLLALPGAYAQTTLNANNAGELASALEQACTSGSATATIRLASMTLESDEVAVYPPVSATCDAVGSPPDITFVPAGTVAEIRLSGVTNGNEQFNLFSLRRGVDATFRGVRLIGPLTGEDGTFNDEDESPGEDFAAYCAELGPRVRGIAIDGTIGGSTRPVLRVEDSYFHCLDAQNGAAIDAVEAIVEIDNSTFDGNSATVAGGAVSVSGQTSIAANDGVGLRITGESVFRRNNAVNGGAVRNDWVGAITEIDRVAFRSNWGSAGAGGVDLIDQKSVHIYRSEFDRQNPTNLDSEQEGGAIRIDSSLYWTATPFDDVPTSGGELIFRNNVVCGSVSGRGGGVFVRDMPYVTVEGSVFAENVGLVYGGGIYIETPATNFEPTLSVVNNTFVGNEAGKTPDFVTPARIYAIGGGGGAAFFGVNAELRNNVIAYSDFGGGVFQEYIPFTNDGFEIGDGFAYTNNLFYLNNDGLQDIHLTGEAASLALHPSNIVDVDPELSYLGVGEYNCVPDAFYPSSLQSPVVDAGGGPLVNGVPGTCQDYVDTNIPSDFDQDSPVNADPCDIGAFGGRYGLWMKDTDLDGFANIFDCDDNDPDVNPGVQELCDNKDNDCNGLVDDGIQSVWYPDDDGDGQGAASVPPVYSCDIQIGYVASTDGTAINTDCDDTNPLTFRGAPEICDGEDNDCNREVDDGLDFQIYFFDGDGDGVGGTVGATGAVCESPGLGYTPVGGDCDDTNGQIHPNAQERCGNGIDDNCNGLVDINDPGVNAPTYYPDLDGDGDGDMNSLGERRCETSPPAGYAATGGDCNDVVAEINSTTAIELCGTQLDEDCDGSIDEADANSDANIFYPDADGDTFGAGSSPVYVCGAATPGQVENGLDCNDADPSVGDCLNSGCSAVGGRGIGFAGVFLGVLALAGRRRR